MFENTADRLKINLPCADNHNKLTFKLACANPQRFKKAINTPLQLMGSHIDKLQSAANNTGLPNQLKSGVEALSGHSLDDVKVHYNSDKPAQLQSQAFAEGLDIHLAAGQQQHLPHEAWHVVQQKQGRVQPTMQMKDSVPVNDIQGLEAEADKLGRLALHKGPAD